MQLEPTPAVPPPDPMSTRAASEQFWGSVHSRVASRVMVPKFSGKTVMLGISKKISVVGVFGLGPGNGALAAVRRGGAVEHDRHLQNRDVPRRLSKRRLPSSTLAVWRPSHPAIGMGTAG